jgi:hypothetical protein
MGAGRVHGAAALIVQSVQVVRFVRRGPQPERQLERNGGEHAHHAE